MNCLSKGHIIILILWNLLWPANAQNLVCNGTFDDYRNYTDSNNVLIYHPDSWYYPPSGDHPYYFSADRFKRKGFSWNVHPDSALIRKGFNPNYIGILIMPWTQKAFTVLNEPLKKGALYNLKLDIKPSNQSNCVSDVMAGFLNCLNGNIDSLLNIVTVSIPGVINLDSVYTEWMNVNTVFTANGGEQVLVLFAGNSANYTEIINNDPEKYRINYDGYPRLKYYVDNIVLKEEKENTLSVDGDK